GSPTAKPFQGCNALTLLVPGFSFLEPWAEISERLRRKLRSWGCARKASLHSGFAVARFASFAERVVYSVTKAVNQTSVRADRIRSRAYDMRRRVRIARRQIERISRTATLGGLFLSFLKIGLVGFGGGVAVLAQIRAVTVRKRRWLTDSEF